MQVKKLVGKEFLAGSLERHLTVAEHLKEFMQTQCKVSDIGIKRIVINGVF